MSALVQSPSPLSPLSPDSGVSWTSSTKSITPAIATAMPVTRNPSERVRDWVKTGATTRVAKPSGSPTEIIHLGGSRVGTPTTGSSASTRSFSTQNQGHTRANTTDSTMPTSAASSHYLMPEHRRANTLDAGPDADRPLTSWFGEETAPAPSANWGKPSILPAIRNVTDSPIQIKDLKRELSPPPLRVQAGNGLGLKAKPSLPTIVTTPSSASSSESRPSTRDRSSNKENHSQSQALQRKDSKWKALPAFPNGSTAPLDKVDEHGYGNGHRHHHHYDHYHDAADDITTELKTLHVGQMIRTDKHITHFFPPPAADPPINVYGKICLEIPRPDSTTIGGGKTGAGVVGEGGSSAIVTTTSGSGAGGGGQVKVAEIKVREAVEMRTLGVHVSQGGRRVPSGKHSREERFWLHKNYRGEVPFLRAWGLDIKSEVEREEGVVIMKELMALEKEKKARKEMEERRARGEEDEMVMEVPAPAPLVVVERETESERGTIGLAKSTGAKSRWNDHEEDQVSVRTVQGIKSPVSVGSVVMHMRQESDASVTDEYVSSRISSFR